MSRRSAGKNSMRFSLFPFLAVLICTMGSLIVLLILMVHQAQVHAETASEAGADATEEIREQFEQRERHIEEIDTMRAKVSGRMQQQMLVMGQVEDHIRRIKEDLVMMHIDAEVLQQVEKDKKRDSKADQAELERLRRLIEDAEKELQKLREEKKNRKPSYAILPYQGPNQTKRRPIYIECTEYGITIQPGGIKLSVNDFRPPLHTGNPLAMALRQTREYWQRKDGDSLEAGEPYPLIVIRPKGTLAYKLVRKALDAWDAEFGYEFVRADRRLAWGQVDPKLTEVQYLAIADARQLRADMERAAPSKYRSGPFVVDGYTITEQGGKIVVLGSPQGEKPGFGVGTGGASGTGNGPGGTGSGMYAGGSSGNNIAGGTGGQGTGPGFGTGHGNQPGLGTRGMVGTGSGTGRGHTAPGSRRNSPGLGGTGSGTGGSPGGLAKAGPGGTGYSPGGPGSNPGQGPYPGGTPGGAGGGHGGGYGPGSGSSHAGGAPSGPYGRPGGQYHSNQNSNGSQQGSHAATGDSRGGHAEGNYTPGPRMGSGQSGSSSPGGHGGGPSGSSGSAGGAQGGTSGTQGGSPGGSASAGGGSASSGGGSAFGSAGGAGGSSGGMTGSAGGSSGGAAGGSAGGSGSGASGGSENCQGGCPSVSIKQQTGGPDGMPTPGQQNLTPIANVKGHGWGLPEQRVAALGITRPIRVACYPDCLVLLPDRGTKDQPLQIRMQANKTMSIIGFVEAVRSQVKSWGTAGTNAYWKPMLNVHVAPGAEGAFREMEILLHNSGIMVERK